MDIVLNFFTGDLLHSSWQIFAEFGHFIEIGKRDIIDNGRLEMETFNKNVTFSAFDLSRFYSSTLPKHQRLWQSLLKRSFQIVRDGKVSPVEHLQTSAVVHVQQAFQTSISPNRMWKVAVTFEDKCQEIDIVPAKYGSCFSPEKADFLVGCLGGLGRSISCWMLERGARNFIFLGRSGMKKPAARSLVEGLRHEGADVDVVRGNVSTVQCVFNAILGSKRSIGGIVQAAMALSDVLWSSMSCESWRTCIDPKVKGIWNIHKALEDGYGSELDFFIMASSVDTPMSTRRG